MKAKPAKIVRDVLGPILQQYGWNLEAMVIKRDLGGGTGSSSSGFAEDRNLEIDLETTVQSIDNSRLVVCSRSAEDINARLLEEMVREKGRSNSSRSEQSRDFDQRSIQTDSSRGSTSNQGGFRGPHQQVKHRKWNYDGIKCCNAMPVYLLYSS